jgi:hypothetical protein
MRNIQGLVIFHDGGWKYPDTVRLTSVFFQEFDFNELENSTEYDGGFSRDTPCVRWFWETVHGEQTLHTT